MSIPYVDPVFDAQETGEQPLNNETYRFRRRGLSLKACGAILVVILGGGAYGINALRESQERSVNARAQGLLEGLGFTAHQTTVKVTDKGKTIFIGCDQFGSYASINPPGFELDLDDNLVARIQKPPQMDKDNKHTLEINGQYSFPLNTKEGVDDFLGSNRYRDWCLTDIEHSTPTNTTVTTKVG